MKKKIALIGFCMLLMGAMACGKTEYGDGTFEGAYADEENGGKTVVKLTLKDQKITDCILESTDKKGNPKDENYGKEAGDANYQKAQRAVQGMKEYPQMLIDVQNIDDVEAVSGATVTHKEFQIAVKEALKKAEK